MSMVCVVLGSLVGAAGAEPAATGFINRTMTVDGEQRQYVVFVPRDYDPAKPWPLVVFLHGMGERGADGYLQTEVGIGRAIRRNAERFPCLVAMPQCTADGWWVPDGSKWQARFQDCSAHIDRCIEETMDAYTVDEDRVYLTGLSMGGFGTWLYGARNADRFAALMPICGGGRPEDAERLAQVPIRAFHGADDDTVPPERSREMAEAVKAAGGEAAYTEYPDTGHNSWDQAYGDADNIAWLLAQRRE